MPVFKLFGFRAYNTGSILYSACRDCSLWEVQAEHTMCAFPLPHFVKVARIAGLHMGGNSTLRLPKALQGAARIP